MQDITFKTTDELERYIMDNMIKQLGIGREGRCYLLKDGSVIKALYDDYYRNFALQFKDLDIPSFIFAQNAAFVGDYVRAVFMKYADGYDLSQKMPMDQDFLLLGEQLNKVVQDLNILSNKGILVRDFYCGNIIYNGKEFRIIDTLPYLFLKGNDYHDQNLYEVMNKIYAKLLGEILKRIDRSHLGNSNGSLHYLGNKERLENPSEYFSLLKRFIKDTTSHDIKTLGDAHGVLQKKYPN